MSNEGNEPVPLPNYPIPAVRRAMNFTVLRGLGQFVQLDNEDRLFYLDPSRFGDHWPRPGDLSYDAYGVRYVHILSSGSFAETTALEIARRSDHPNLVRRFPFQGYAGRRIHPVVGNEQQYFTDANAYATAIGKGWTTIQEGTMHNMVDLVSN